MSTIIRRTINNKQYMLFILFASFLLIGLFYSSAVFAGSLGVSPPTVSVKALSGGEIIQKIRVQIDDPDPNLETIIMFEVVDDYNNAITVPEEIIMAPGQREIYFDIKIKPEGDITGDHSVTIKVKRQPTGSIDSGAGVKVFTGANVVVNYSITGEEILKYEVKYIDIKDTEPEQELSVNLNVENTGNVIWSPSKIVLEINELEDTTNTSTIELTGDQIPDFLPGNYSQETVSVAHSLIEGEYKANIKFYEKDKVVSEFETNSFKVLEPGTLKQSGNLISIDTNKKEYNIGEKIKIEAVFENSGSVPIDSNLVVEIMKEDGTVVDFVRGESFETEVGDNATMEELFDIKDVGNYVLSAYVEYGNRKTNKQDIEISIIDPDALNKSGGINMNYIYLGLLGLLIIIATIVYKYIKNLKAKLSTPQAQAPQAQAPQAQAPQAQAQAPQAQAQAPPAQAQAPQAQVDDNNQKNNNNITN